MMRLERKIRSPYKENNHIRFSHQKIKNAASIFILILFLFVAGCAVEGVELISFTLPEGDIQVAFSVAADMRGYTGNNRDYFRTTCDQIAFGGRGDFMISPGDIDPPDRAYQTIQTFIGEDYTWYPVVGNHDAENPYDMDWLRLFNWKGKSLPNVVNAGPAGSRETTYSFDYGEAHFIVLNEYYDGKGDTGTDGDVVDSLYDWLVDDLSTNTKPVVFVFGHEPAYPRPDDENGRIRHAGDSLNLYAANRDRFWNALSLYGVTAYICGHTHNYSTFKKDGVWQIDAGHARGAGDTGARSTFVMFYVMTTGSVWHYTYRFDLDNRRWELADFGELA
jgi:hypothetical protein